MAVTAQYIYEGLKRRGLNDAQIYATLGNWKQESEFNPGAINPGEGALGLDQWRLERRDALEQLAKATGRSPTDPELQMDFYVKELGYHPGGKAFMAANNIEDANRALKTYISYGSPYDKGGEGTRLKNAQMYANQGLSKGLSLNSTPIGNVVPGTGTFTENVNQQTNEADPGVYGNPSALTVATSGDYPPAPGSTAAPSEPASFVDTLKGVLGDKDTLKDLGKAVGRQEGDKGELQASNIGAMEGADAARAQAAATLMSTIMANRKKYGTTLNSAPMSLAGFMG